MKSKKIVLYARVSTDGQAEEGFSIDAQLDKMRKNAENDDHTIVDEYIDRGISGKSMLNRPALQHMLRDAKQGKFDEVWVWKLSRIARNNLDLLTIDKMFREYNISLKSYSESFDTSTPSGKLLFNMLAGISEFERETIVDNVKSGMKQRAKQGYHNGGRLLGYRSVPSSNIQEKRMLVIDPEEAELVRLIFELYLSGKGYKAIVNYVNDRNYKTIKGNNFDIQGVRNIIKNPTYAGYIQFNRIINCASKRKLATDEERIFTKGSHEPIVSMEIWTRAKEINMKKAANNTKKIKKGFFILTGLLKCPHCGASMVAGRVNKTSNGEKIVYNYYQCSRYKNVGRNGCKPNSIPASYAEEYVLESFKQYTVSDHLIKKVVDTMNKDLKTKTLPLVKKLEKTENELSKLSNKIDRLFDLMVEGVISNEEFRQKQTELEKSKMDLRDSINQLKCEISQHSNVVEIPFEYVKSVLTNFYDLLMKANREEQKALLYSLIEKITMSDDKKIDEIILRFTENSHRVFSEKGASEEAPFYLPFCITID